MKLIITNIAKFEDLPVKESYLCSYKGRVMIIPRDNIKLYFENKYKFIENNHEITDIIDKRFNPIGTILGGYDIDIEFEFDKGIQAEPRNFGLNFVTF